MKSSKNINQPPQGTVTATSLTDYANSRQGLPAVNNPIRTQRSSQEPSVSSSRGRSNRTNLRRGRHNEFSTKPRISTHEALDRLPQEGSPNRSSTIEVANNSTSTNRGHKPHDSRANHGKYRQRQHISRLLDGTTSLDGLDIDLAESIVPTEQASARTSEVTKNRHATNSRKVNLTHLLNYKFDSKHRSPGYKSPSSFLSEGSSNQHRNARSHYRDYGAAHKFSKQQFLQANCQFVVLDGHDYSVHKADPDWPIDWDCIEEIRFKQSASTETSCPICLEPPVAAKITRCGHIYCWTCMLHYLSLSDENCRQCPICFEPVYKGDLRSVISHSYMNYSAGDEIVMKLMIRKKGCVDVEPYKSEPTYTSISDYNHTQPPSIDDYLLSQANLVIVDSPTVISKIIQREHNDLSIKLATDRDEPEVCFIEQALDLLKMRAEKLHSKVVSKPRKTMDQNPSISPEQDSSKCYLFYQCSDGQHIYLNPFSTKTLCHEHKNLENCPLEIRAKVLQMDWISMSEAWRKRFRYLEHLPLTCEFRLIEIDFEGSNLISDETYKVFEDQIKRREQERARRRKEERKREKIIQVEQNRKIYGIQPSLKINLDNIDQFPSVSDERYLGLSQPRHQSRVLDGQSSDDDDLDETSQNTIDGPSQPVQVQLIEETSDKDTSAVNDTLALSFKDIQLQQQAASSSNLAKDVKQGAIGSWGAKPQSSASNHSSSFANILLDAKTSQKEWTRNVSSSVVNHPKGNSEFKQGISSLRPGSDDGEELRAPPCDFTISDFIDMNMISSVKKKGKQKRSIKKS